MQFYIEPKVSDWPSINKRPVLAIEQLNQLISELFDNINQNGNQALIEYTEKFDKVKIQTIEFQLDSLEAIEKKITNSLKKAIHQAYDNIYKFHAAQQLKFKVIETTPGVKCWQESRAIERIGIYIPGGTAPLFSTILMLAIPAKIAGCKEIILCTPPDKNATINPVIQYVAKLTGVTQIFTVGGAQAIAAMSLGTETIPKVYKIFGPGNQYVTTAKQYAQLFGTAIDMPAGPSELLIVADETANPAYIAADLLSQAEHGTDSQVIAVLNSEAIAQKVQLELFKQLTVLERKEIAQKALENAKFIILKSLDKRIAFINEYAPEHLIINTKDNDIYCQNICNAGSVFIGNYTPESAGDYASGTNHTLPTNAYAKAYSGVNLDTFVKKITFQEISPAGLQQLGESIELMALEEGLTAHKNAVSIRLKDLK